MIKRLLNKLVNFLKCRKGNVYYAGEIIGYVSSIRYDWPDDFAIIEIKAYRQSKALRDINIDTQLMIMEKKEDE